MAEDIYWLKNRIDYLISWGYRQVTFSLDGQLLSVAGIRETPDNPADFILAVDKGSN